MTNTKDFVRDICKFVASTGFFEKIKISASNKEVVIETMGIDKEVILKAKIDKAIIDLEGEFGLSNLDLLKHITNDSEFADKGTELTAIYEIKNGEKIPTEFKYQNKSKTFINYRFMSKNLVPDQAKFNVPKWDIVISPSKSSIQQFAWAATGLSSYEEFFVPKIVNNELKFFIGDESAANQRGGIVFDSDQTGTFDTKLKWKINPIQAVLKLSDSAECEMSFSVKGAIQITLTTGVGVYKFIFPAKVQ
jgi:hypothetical protein